MNRIIHIIFLVICFLTITGSMSAQRVGLVLSGGGAKGIAHIGLIKALEENNIPIDYITGTSIGAIVGGMYAMGYSPEEMMDLVSSKEFLMWQSGQVEEDYVYYFKKLDPTPEFVRFKISVKDTASALPLVLPKSLINPVQLNFAFMKLFAPSTALCQGDFDKLFVPFRCVASDVYNKKEVVFKSGDLGDAVRSSMTFPFVYNPIKIDSILLYDGGIYDNFPIQPMKKDFAPDFIIGSVVASDRSATKIKDNDLMRQLENMVMQKTNYQVPKRDGILIRFAMKDVNLLDFQKAGELYEIGYEKGLQYVDSIRRRVSRSVPEEDVEVRRTIYKSEMPELTFKNIRVEGVTKAQKEYIENAIHKNDREFSLQDFKTAYFKLLSDSKISEIIPHAVYNYADNCFDLDLKVIMDENVVVAFGGNISSTNSGQAYLGIGYQSLSKYAVNYNLDGYFGFSYNAALLSGRIDLPTMKMPMYLQMRGVFSSRKYYNSENLFYTGDVLAFIRQNETYANLKIGFPFLMKGKAEISLGYGELRDWYYQSNNVDFAKTDFDRSKYNFAVGAFRIEHNSLNAKQYAIDGSNQYLLAQLIVGTEDYISASVPGLDGKMLVVRESKSHSWMQIKGYLRHYYTITPRFNYGIHIEGVISGKNLFNNYTSTIIQAPAFTPTPHSKTVMNERLRANQYAAGGFIPIWKLNKMFHLRTELYGFIPFNEIMRDENNKAYPGDFFRDFEYLGEMSLICQLPFMSIAIFGNKYSYPKDNWNFGLNIGFLLFASKLIE
ncbi:MAG: patatin-like phospholipase family protein [Candidatus Azobacteroides sp.]|nr:patatin-like phospholipase family protein [Candidatus Azobacteroides sp.]